MPISAEQWRSVVGSNSIKRPHQIGPKGFFGGRSGRGNKQLPADALNHGLLTPCIGVVFGLLWLWSYQYTGSLVLMEPGRCSTYTAALLFDMFTAVIAGVLSSRTRPLLF